MWKNLSNAKKTGLVLAALYLIVAVYLAYDAYFSASSQSGCLDICILPRDFAFAVWSVLLFILLYFVLSLFPGVGDYVGSFFSGLPDPGVVGYCIGILVHAVIFFYLPTWIVWVWRKIRPKPSVL